MALITDHLKSLFLNDMVGEGGRPAPVGDVHRKVQRDLTAPSETGIRLRPAASGFAFRFAVTSRRDESGRGRLILNPRS